MKLRLPSKLVAAIMAAASPVLLQTLSTATLGAAAVAGQQAMGEWIVNDYLLDPAEKPAEGVWDVDLTERTTINLMEKGGTDASRQALLGTVTLSNGAALTIASNVGHEEEQNQNFTDLRIGVLSFGSAGNSGSLKVNAWNTATIGGVTGSLTSVSVEKNGKLTLSGTTNHIAAGKVNGELHLNLLTTVGQGGDSIITLDEGSDGHVYVDSGLFSLNKPGQGSSSNLQNASLHMADGTTFRIRNGMETGDDINLVKKVYVSGEMLLSLGNSVSVNTVLHTDFLKESGAATAVLNRTDDTGSLTIAGTVNLDTITSNKGTLKFTGSTTAATYNANGNTSTLVGTSNITNFNVTDGTANIGGSATIGTFEINGGTANLSGTSVITKYNQYGGTTNITGTTTIGANDSTVDTLISRGGTLVFGDTNNHTASDVTVNGKWQIGNSGGRNASITIAEGASVTANVIESNWGFSQFKVDGVLNAKTLSLSTGSQAYSVTGGGVINTTNLQLGNVGYYTISVSRINIGSGGIKPTSNGSGSSRTFDGVTFGATADWTASQDYALSNTVTFDTSNAETLAEGAAEEGHTITLSGVLSGSGSLVKVGAGTLKLNGANTFTGGIINNGGTLLINNEAVTVSALKLGEGSVTQLQGGITLGSLTANGGDLVLNDNAHLQVNAPIALGSGALTVSSGVYLDMTPTAFSQAKLGEYSFTEDDGHGHKDGYVIGDFQVATANSVVLSGQPSTGTLTVRDLAESGQELVLTLDGTEGGNYMVNWNVDYATGSKVTRGNHNAYGASRIYLTTPLNAQTGQQSVLNLKSALQSGVDIVSNGGVLNLGDGVVLNASALNTVGTEETTLNSNGSTGALVISGTHTAANNIFANLTGNANVKVSSNTTLQDGVSSTLTGTLLVNSGAVLTVGTGDSQNNSISSFTGVSLDNGTIKYQNKKDTLLNLSVAAGKTGKIASKDMGNSNGDKLLLDGDTRVDGTLTISNYWNAQFEINHLVGCGTLRVTGMAGADDLSDNTSSNELATYTINSLSGFTGTLSVDNSNASVTLNTGNSAVDFSALTVTHSKTGDGAGVTLNAQNAAQIGTVSIASGSQLTLGGTGVITLTSAIQNAGILKLADNATINLNAEASGGLLGYGTVDSYTENGNGYAIASGVSATLVNAAENSTFTQGTGVTYTLNGAAATLVDNRLSLGEGNNRLSNTYHVNTTETFDGVPAGYADMTGLNVKASQGFTLTNGSLNLRNVTVAAGGSVTVGNSGELSLESAAFAADATLTTSAGKTTLLGAATVNYIINSATGDAADAGLFIGEGGVLTLNEKGSGQSYIRGNITVQDGGTLVLRHDSTGYSGGATAVNKITVDAGGKLQLGMNNNDTFRGTLVLNGLLETAPTNSGAWMDLFTNSQVLVSNGQHGVVSANTYFRLRNSDTQFNIGEGATLTMNGRIIKTGTTEGNNSIKKLGAGEMILNNTTDLNAVALAGGKLTFNDTTTLTQITTDSNTASTIAGSGPITVAGTSSAAALSVGAGVTLNLEADNLTLRNSDFDGYEDARRKYSLAITGSGSTVNINSGVTTVYGATYIGTNKATLNIGTGSSEATLVTTRLEIGDAQGGSHAQTGDKLNYLNIGSKGKVVVTGNWNNVGGNAYANSLLMGEWQTATVANIAGKFYAKDAILSSHDYPVFLTIANGGIMAVEGLDSNRTSSTARPAFNLTLQGGGKLILGQGGLKGQRAETPWTINLAGGEIGMTADMEMKRAMTLQSGTTTTFNTAKYTWRGEGADQEVVSGTEGGTMTVSGGLSGSGSLTKVGPGTLVLSGEVGITGTATVNGGELTLSGEEAKSFAGMNVSNGALNINSATTVSNAVTSGVDTFINVNKNLTAGSLSVSGEGTHTIRLGNNAVMTAGNSLWLGLQTLNILNTTGSDETVSGGSLVLNNLLLGVNGSLEKATTVNIAKGNIVRITGTAASDNLNNGLVIWNGSAHQLNIEGTLVIEGGIRAQKVQTPSGTTQSSETYNIGEHGTLQLNKGITFVSGDSDVQRMGTINVNGGTLAIGGQTTGSKATGVNLKNGSTVVAVDATTSTEQVFTIADSDATVNFEADAGNELKLNGAFNGNAATASVVIKAGENATAVSKGVVTLNNGTENLAAVQVEGNAQLKLSQDNALNVSGKTAIVKNGDAAVLEGVTVDAAGITKTDGASDAIISHAHVTVGSAPQGASLLALADEVSYTIQDVALVDTNVVVNEQIAVSNVSLDAASSIHATGTESTLAAANTLTLNRDHAEIIQTNSNLTTSQLSGLTLQSGDGNTLAIDLGATKFWGVDESTGFKITLSDFRWEDLASDGSYLVDTAYDLSADNALDYLNTVFTVTANGTALNVIGAAIVAGEGGSAPVALQLTVVPEPATSVLSLLALAGMAARRKRK